MASGKTWTNICPDCGRTVEILNDDFEFSMELHKQSHKSLDQVNALVRNLNRSSEKVDNASKLKLNYCHDCKESFEIMNHDLGLSFQLHAQRHKPGNADTLSDHSSSSSKSKGSEKVAKKKEQPQPAVTSILDEIFHTMPIGLKAHREFIVEQGCSKATCNLCEITVEPIFRISDHLKTKLHEDNTISAIKSTLSSELHDQIEFISFYGSNLCCNLCRCKIDLCSENLHKTAVNIFVHNAGKGHMSKKSASKDGNQSNETHAILTSFALMNPLVNENQHLIEHKMYPHFKCKPCEKQIAYSENQNEMVNNFTNHFNSQGHIKHLSAVSLLSKWSSLNNSGKEKHNFVVAKENIYCMSCKTDVEANLDQLFTHVRRDSASYNTVHQDMAINAPNVKTENLYPHQDKNTRMSENLNKQSDSQLVQSQDSSAKFRRLVQMLPTQFRGMIIQNRRGEIMCSVCNCIVASPMKNLITHLNGNSHKKKENVLKSSKSNSDQPPKTFDPPAKVPLLPNPPAKVLLLPNPPAKVPLLPNPPAKVPLLPNPPANCDNKFDLLASNYRLLGNNKEVLEDNSGGCDGPFEELLKYIKEIRANSKYLTKESDDYFCKLCKAIIKNSFENNLLEGNIMSHMAGKKHKKDVEDEFNDVLDKIQLASAVKSNRQFFEESK